MLKTMINALKIEEIRKKLLFTFLMLIVVRLGSQLPIPGVNQELITGFFDSLSQRGAGAFNFFNALTGGSFESMSIFALSISPYITSSIIMQLLTIAIPKLEEMQKDGEDGRKKISKITRFVTVALALIQATAMTVAFRNQGYLVEGNDFITGTMVVLTMTAGSAFLMWAGERITEKGIGNGISIILLINILSSIPTDVSMLYSKVMENDKTIMKILATIMIIAIILFVVVFVVLLQGGERKIAVQYSQKVQGRKTVGGQSSHIPMKVNTAGVIPVIFASSLMQFPILIAAFFNKSEGTGFWYEILYGLNSTYWFNRGANFYRTWGLIIYIVLTIAFAYFYTSITFNPMEIANNMKKNGGFVPGIRPGRPTVDYLTKILNYIVFVGAVALIIIQVIPFFFNGWFGASVSFGGTSLIIIVGVVLETIQQIESKMLVRNYKGFLNSGK